MVFAGGLGRGPGLGDRRGALVPDHRGHPPRGTVLQVPPGFAFWPFGKEVAYGGGRGVAAGQSALADFQRHPHGIGPTPALGLVFCATIVGIPFGLQCFKLAKLALMPFGASVLTQVRILT